MVRFLASFSKGVDVRLSVNEGEKLGGGRHRSTEGNTMGCESVDGDCGNDHRVENPEREGQRGKSVTGQRRHSRENGTDVLDLASGNHSHSLPEGKTHTGVDDEVLGPEHDTVEPVLLSSQISSLLRVCGILSDDALPKIKSVDGPGAAENTLCKTGSLCVGLDDLGLNLRVQVDDGADNDDKGGRDADDDQGEFPLGDEGDDECGHEC